MQFLGVSYERIMEFRVNVSWKVLQIVTGQQQVTRTRKSILFLYFDYIHLKSNCYRFHVQGKPCSNVHCVGSTQKIFSHSILLLLHIFAYLVSARTVSFGARGGGPALFAHELQCVWV